MKYIAFTLLSALLLSGCSYYAKQTALVPESSSQWKRYGYSEAVSYACDDTKIIVSPILLSSQKMAHSCCLIPFVPAAKSKQINYVNSDWPLTFTISVQKTNGKKYCNFNPEILLQNSSVPIEPTERYMDPVSRYRTGGNSYDCKYKFERTEELFSNFTFVLNPEDFTCKIEPLKYVFTEGVKNINVPLQ